MKKLFLTLLICFTTLSFTSCITEAYAETSLYDDDIEIVIRYGTPYYEGSTLIYYYYDGFYFYPYRYNNAWRFHRYSRPLPPPRHHSAQPRPHHSHNDGHHGTRPHGNGHFGNGNSGHHATPGTTPPRGNGHGQGTRPSNPPRMNNGGMHTRPNSSTRMTPSRGSSPSMGGGGSRPHSGFGGRR